MNRIRTATLASALFAIALAQETRADWPVFDRDPARSGYAIGDNTISISNVARLHRRWVATFPAAADGAPILASGVPAFANVSLTVLYQETLLGTTYAINAYTGSIVWKHTTLGPNITNSMPAADPSGQWIYAPGVDGFVHKLAASDGDEFLGGGFPLRVTWSPEIEKDGTALNVANGYLYAATGGATLETPASMTVIRSHCDCETAKCMWSTRCALESIA